MDAALLKQIATLPRNEQLELAEAIWDGLIAQEDLPPFRTHIATSSTVASTRWREHPTRR